MSRDPLDYKEGRGDYYLAEGLREARRSDPTPQPDENVSPRTARYGDLIDEYGARAVEEIRQRVQQEASSPALDVERLAQAVHDSTWACPTGQVVSNWCDPRRGELFHVSQAQSIVAEYARLSTPEPSE